MLRSRRRFSSARQRDLVLLLVDPERSLQELADVSRMSLSLLHYHVRRLQSLGLIEVVRYKARSGRPVRIFRSTARTFFVPAYLMSKSPEDKLYAELRARSDRRSGEGILYSVDEHAAPRMQKMRGKAAIPWAEFWLAIRLSNADAQSLAEEMKSLLARYERRGAGRTRAYLVHCVMAPK
jgi:predicted ArsR family transcriptional regulator